MELDCASNKTNVIANINSKRYVNTKDNYACVWKNHLTYIYYFIPLNPSPSKSKPPLSTLAGQPSMVLVEKDVIIDNQINRQDWPYNCRNIDSNNKYNTNY